jgi:hypothetical protein
VGPFFGLIWVLFVVVIGVSSLVPEAPGVLGQVEHGVVVVVVALAIASLPWTAFKNMNRASEGVEHKVMLQSTFVAFFFTMTFSVAYAFLEFLARAPHLNMIVIWTIGMGSWIVASAVISRRVH